MTNELIMEVIKELLDARFIGHRKHYSRSTYKNGCHGPLCKKAERDKRVRRYAINKPSRVARPRSFADRQRDDYLEKVIQVFGLRSEQQLETEREAEALLAG